MSFPAPVLDSVANDLAPTKPSAVQERRVVGQTLRFALAETAAGASKVVLLVGDSGSGKTQQAHDLLPVVRQRGGMLIESRVESLNWSNPLDSLLLGLSQLSQPLCSQLSNPSLSGQDAVLELGKRLGLIQQVNVEIDLSLAMNLHLLVGELLSFASQQLRPLVWVIDDVDLLDQDALALLDYVIEYRATPYLMLLLCVRDERLPYVQRWIAQPGCQLARLAPFSVRDTVSWLIEEQNINPRLAAEIAPFLQQTCQGNLQLCRFLVESLSAHNLLTPVPEVQWQQRVQQIALQLRAPEAETYFVQQLRSLTETGLEILQSASLIGMEFDARLLHDYLPNSAVHEHLNLAQSLGLIEVQFGDIWRFAHPQLLRLAQQTFELHSEAELHARLAQRMLKFPNFALQALRHAQQAAHLLQPSDRMRIAEQSLSVAKQSLQQGSPMHAGQILEQILVLLGDSVWLEQTQLSEQMVEVLCASWQEPAQLKNAVTLFRSLPATASPRVTHLLATSQVRLALLGHNFPAVFAAAEQSLQTLGIRFSMQGGVVQTLTLLMQWLALRHTAGRKSAISMDNRINEVQQVFASMFGPCFFARPQLLPAMTLKQLILALQHGTGPANAGAKMCAALILNAFARYDAAFKLAAEAGEMAQALIDDRQRHRVPILDLALVQPWRQSLSQILPNLWRWQQNAFSAGDFEFAGYANMFYIGHSVLNGSPLDHLEKEAAKVEESLVHTSQRHLLPMSAVFRQCLHNLVRTTVMQPWRCEGHIFSAEALTDLQQRNDGLNQFNFYILTAAIASFCHASEPARDALREAKPYLESVRGSVLAAEYRFLLALNRCSSVVPSRWLWHRRMKRDVAQLKSWAVLNPSLFACKSALVQAEYANASGLEDEVQQHYLAAIDAAKEHHHSHELGMAALYYGRFLLRQLKFHHARQMLLLAIEQYDLWGAAGVSAYLHREFGAFLNKRPQGM